MKTSRSSNMELLRICAMLIISATMTVLICYIKEKNKTIRKEIVCTKKYNKINKDLRKKKKKRKKH